MPSVFLPLVPNWGSVVTDTFEFLTDIFASDDGTEQRRSNRMLPRRNLSMSMILDDDRRRIFADSMNRMRENTAAIADFGAEPAFIIGINPKKIYGLSHIPSWMTVGTEVAIVTGRWAMQGTVITLGDFEYDIDAYTEDFGGLLTVSFGPIVPDGMSGVHVLTEAIFPVDGVSFEASGFNQGFAGGMVNPAMVDGPGVGDGSYLLPIVDGYFGKTNTTTIMTNNTATTNFVFEVVPGMQTRTPDATPQAGAAALYKGRYVLLRKPNFLSPPTAAFTLPFDKIDYGRGVSRLYTNVPIVKRTLTGTYLGIGRKQVEAILDVFLRSLGRAGEILVPTWGLDFPPVVSVTGKSIKFFGINFYDAYAGDTAHKTILLHSKSGTACPMTIDTMTTTEDSTIVVFEEDVPFTKAAILGASWLFVARFAQDSLSCDWITANYANVVLSFTTLENVDAERGFGSDWSLETGYFKSGAWTEANIWPSEVIV